MNENALSFRDAGHAGNRIDCAHLVICVHHRDKARLRPDRSAEIFQLYTARSIDIQIGHFEPGLFKPRAGLEDRMMLGFVRDDVVPAPCHQGPARALEREIIRLCSAADKEDLARLRPDQASERIAALVERRPRFPPEMMNRRGVSETAAKKRFHCLEDSGIERSGGGMIEIDSPDSRLHSLNIRRFPQFHNSGSRGLEAAWTSTRPEGRAYRSRTRPGVRCKKKPLQIAPQGLLPRTQSGWNLSPRFSPRRRPSPGLHRRARGASPPWRFSPACRSFSRTPEICRTVRA